MIELAKRIVAGTSMEFPLRRLHRRLFWRYSKQTRYDFETCLVMGRVLGNCSNCIDVGCHKGNTLREILRLAANGTHYAFEPIPELYQELLSKFPTVNILNLALSDSRGKAFFYDVVSCTGLSGLKKRNLEEKHRLSRIQVATDTLDHIVPDDLPIHFIKIDVEGAELLVLRGAIKTIAANKPVIVFEHGLGGADFFDSTPEDIYDLIVGQCGLRISLMQSWLNGEAPLGLREFADQFYQHCNYYFMAHP